MITTPSSIHLTDGIDDRPLRGSSLVTSTVAIAGRTVRKFVRTPQLIVIGIVQSAMFLLIFRYVFGGAIGTPGVRYVDFLVPGFIAANVLFCGTGTSVGVAEDMEAGFTDRLRSLPMPRTSVIAGRALADTALLALILGVTAGVGFGVGYRLRGSVLEGVAAFGLCIVFGFAFEWFFILLGVLSGNAQAAQGMAMIVFPLTFVSSAYVPVGSMPGWMQPFARNQPVTAMVDAIRSLTLGDHARAVLGHASGHYIGRALLWCVVLVVVFAPIAVGRYRRT
ncbi:MAG: type transporter [Ilumatobacteraceae bacterium]|nr:type transporter [Ilumatobacteraceae bacterium]MCU1391073.1 type transporter [Ilumatobacteraceae bacterium]